VPEFAGGIAIGPAQRTRRRGQQAGGRRAAREAQQDQHRSRRRSGPRPDGPDRRQSKDRDAPATSNNACVIYEKIFKYGEATKCYERLANDYPDNPLAKTRCGTRPATSTFFEFERRSTATFRSRPIPSSPVRAPRREAWASPRNCSTMTSSTRAPPSSTASTRRTSRTSRATRPKRFPLAATP